MSSLLKGFNTSLATDIQYIRHSVSNCVLPQGQGCNFFWCDAAVRMEKRSSSVFVGSIAAVFCPWMEALFWRKLRQIRLQKAQAFGPCGIKRGGGGKYGEKLWALATRGVSAACNQGYTLQMFKLSDFWGILLYFPGWQKNITWNKPPVFQKRPKIQCCFVSGNHTAMMFW